MNKFNFSSKDVIENQSNKQNTTPSTNKIILDYLLYLSIQSRLKQASVELLELSFPLPKERETLEERKKRWVESAAKAEQDKHAVEAIVAGNKHPLYRRPNLLLQASFLATATRRCLLNATVISNNAFISVSSRTLSLADLMFLRAIKKPVPAPLRPIVPGVIISRPNLSIVKGSFRNRSNPPFVVDTAFKTATVAAYPPSANQPQA